MSDAALPGPDVADRAALCEALTEGRRHEEAIPMDEYLSIDALPYRMSRADGGGESILLHEHEIIRVSPGKSINT
jgi:hypothetical protein